MPQPCPAVSPDQTKDTERCPPARSGNARPAFLPAFLRRFRTEPGRKYPARPEPFERDFRREVMIWQRVRRYRANDGRKTFDRRAVHLHSRRPVRARPHHRGIRRYVAGCQPARDPRTVGGPAQVGRCEAPEACQRGGGCRAHQQLTSGQALSCTYRNRHLRSLVESRRRVPAELDSRPKVLRQADETREP